MTYDWLDQYGLGAAFCLTFVRDPGVTRVLHRFGADPASIGPAAGPAGTLSDQIVMAGRLADWVFVLEPNGYQGTRPEVLRAVSTGTEAVSVFTNVNGDTAVNHAVDGVTRAWADTDLGAALRATDRITGVHLAAEHLNGPLTTGHLIPLLPDPPLAPSWMLRDDHDLIAAIDAADPAVLRRAVVTEARQRAEDAGIADHPLIRQALTQAERGETPPVDGGSELGLLLRGWADRSRTAGDSLTLPAPDRTMTRAERQQAFHRHAAGLAVRAALFPDTRRAAYEVLGWVAPARDATRVARRARILAHLRG